MGGSAARVGAGGRDSSGLSKACLRARACCDVAPEKWFEGRVHGRNLNARDLARAPTANFSVRYSKSLTVGVKKKKIFYFVM